MPIETNLNTTPYWDDYSPDKDFYKILFKPGVSVQTRELNQLQTIIQNQLERFGDHVFKSGTIVSGCNFIYNSGLQYIKIKDLQEDGQPVNPSSLVGYFLKNSANLQAQIVSYSDGFESKDPNLNTLYLNYINSGNTFNLTEFSNDDVLEVISKTDSIFDVDVVNGGLNFSNSDTLVVYSAINVQVSSGTFSNGEIITQSTTGAKQQIVGIQDGSNSTLKILSVKPLGSEQLANTSANSASWSFYNGYNVTGNTSSAVANVVSAVGSGAYGSIVTDSLGVVQNIVLASGGKGYKTLPKVVIKPSSASATVNTLDLVATGYKAKIRVANNSFTAPTGTGYSFGITQGIIYQKGIFSRVSPQSVIVSKYDNTPNGVSVGFISDESIIKYTTDSSLYDNAANTYNEAAPGADRLKIFPKLYVVNTDVGSANSEFLPLVEFIEGNPARENKNTVYNELAKEFETRMYESAGDYVINSFRSITKEKTSNTTHITSVVDPGVAYITGKRVQTYSNVLEDVQKANSVFTRTNQTITANYGNYIRVKELVGFFDFKSGSTVTLYDTAQSLLTNVTVGSSFAITPSGNAIGTARMRSIVYDQGTVGTPDAVYRLYLFDITMNAGKSFRNVRSFYFNGSYDGVCDSVLELDATTNANVAVIYDSNNPDIIFNIGPKAVKSISDINYTYRTSTENLTLNSNGTIQITSPVTYVFPYSGSLSLSASQKTDFVVTPVSNVVASNSTGTVSVNTTSINVVGTSTTFSSIYKNGDYISIYNGPTTYDVRRIENVVNNTLLIVNANLSFTNTTSNSALFLPAYYPIPISDRTNRTITTSANSSVVTIDIANSNLTTSANVVAFYNIKIPSATQINKDLNRDLLVKIYTGNNTTVSSSGNNTTGPWSLGVPDVLRLKNVYLGNTTSNTDITKYFYINSYNDGGLVKNAQLKLIPGSSLNLSNTQWLLVKFDAFDNNGNEGFITINSYNDIINDGSGYSNNTYINRLEVPEFLTSDGRYYDCIDCFDFRPYVSNTAVLTSTEGSASVNPPNTQSLNSDEKYFPVPDSEIFFDLEFYGSRIDRLVVRKDGSIKNIQGASDQSKVREPSEPSDSLTINRMFIPPYPSLPSNISNTTIQILDKKLGNDSSIINFRQKSYTITNLSNAIDSRAQPRRYTMSQINKLEKRITALEKQVSLNSVEKSITDLVIPSTNDPAKNRFKNAFLVDSFLDSFSIDVSSVENTAYVDTFRGELLPLTYSLNLESLFDLSDAATSNNINNSVLMLPYSEFTLISQLSASEPPVVKPEPPPPVQTSPVQDAGPVSIHVEEKIVKQADPPAANTEPDTGIITTPNTTISTFEYECRGYDLVTIDPTTGVEVSRVVNSGQCGWPPIISPPPRPELVKITIDGSVTYWHPDYVRNYLDQYRDVIAQNFNVNYEGVPTGTESTFDKYDVIYSINVSKIVSVSAEKPAGDPINSVTTNDNTETSPTETNNNSEEPINVIAAAGAGGSTETKSNDSEILALNSGYYVDNIGRLNQFQ